MKKKFLSVIVTLAIFISIIIMPGHISYAISNEAYQGIFMKGDTFIAILLGSYVEPGEPIGVIYHISKPTVGNYGYVDYEHYGNVGDIYEINDKYYIKSGLFDGELNFDNNSIVLSGNSKHSKDFTGSYVQVSNSGANMSPSMIWLNIPEQIRVILNGTELSFDQPPIMENDRVMVPMRAIFEALGYRYINWNEKTQVVFAFNGCDHVQVQINNPEIEYCIEEISWKTQTYLCDVPPKIVSDRTLVPLRAISECAGCNVDWNGETKTVIITSNQSDTPTASPSPNNKLPIPAPSTDNKIPIPSVYIKGFFQE